MSETLLSEPTLNAAAGLHPVLEALFGAFERAGLNWTLLRMPSNPAAPAGDIDVLVAPRQAHDLRELAATEGFVALPGWDEPPNLILVRYDAGSDRWFVLDVFTEVAFRSPRGWLLAGAVEGVLARRRLAGGVALPAEPDEFWLLALHCLLDKREVPPRHLARLQRLAVVGARSPLLCALQAAAGESLSPGLLLTAAREGDAAGLARLGPALAQRLRRRQTAAERATVALAAARRVVRKPALLRRRRGVSVALLGPNGVGKSTAAAGLAEAFPFGGRTIYMGLWKASGPLEPLLRPLRVWGRYARAVYHRSRGRLVVFDRYVYEALLPASGPLLALKRPYFWLLARMIPPPTVVVVLDAPGVVTYGRKQENPPDELESERAFYARIAEVVPGRRAVVDATRDADTVRAEIGELAWRAVAARWQGAR